MQRLLGAGLAYRLKNTLGVVSIKRRYSSPNRLNHGFFARHAQLMYQLKAKDASKASQPSMFHKLYAYALSLISFT
ncbi:hypothetical protein VN23_20125 [Janthinobacterium sp. B9-8]|nr:hypothetical protein VN23_20125 [Janthinobacterium sp. B9-8]